MKISFSILINMLIMGSILSYSSCAQNQSFKSRLIELQENKEWKIVFSDGSSELYFLNIEGAIIPIFKSTDTKKPFRNYPSFSPDGKKIVFCVSDGQEDYLEIINIDGSNPKKLMELKGVSHSSWSPDSKNILFLAGGYKDKVNKKVYTAEDFPTKLHIINIQDKTIKTFDDSRAFASYTPSWAPDGKSIVYQTVDKNIMIANIDTLKIRKLGEGEAPSWSPDDKKIAYREERAYYTITPDGSNKKLLLKKPSILKSWYEKIEGTVLWSPDGRFILFHRDVDKFGGDWEARIYIMDIENKESVQIGKIIHLTGISWWGKS